MVAVIVVRNNTTSGGKEEVNKEVCDTPACITAAYSLLSNMNPEVDPCEDFYQYACGGFEKRERIPDDRSSRSQFSLINDDLENQIRDLLETNSTDSDSIVFKQSRDMYKACMNMESIESIGLTPLKDDLEEFGSWPVLNPDWNGDDFDWKELIYKFRQKGHGVSYMISYSIGTDIKNSSYRVMYFDQPYLGLSREYLVKGLEDEQVKYYYSYMQNAAVLLGADPEVAAEQLKESLLFEIKLANASLPREERRNSSKLYNPMLLQDLNNLVPDVDFTEYVNKILTEDILQVDGNERVIVSNPGYLKNLTEILKSEPKRNIANYLIWRIVKASLSLLNEDARDVSLKYVKNITGKTEDSPRWKKCVDAAGFFSAAIGNLYVSSHFNEMDKNSMLEMVKYIREEFKTLLEKISWMDPETRSRAIKKLGAIKEYIGYPEEIMDATNLENLYDGVEIFDDTYYKNSFSTSLWSYAYSWKKLREKVDKTDWKRHADPAVVNAFYSSIENSIQFPAGILQGTFFNNKRPQYLNYGGIGWVIGHELTHGFDDQGRQYDDEGNLSDWWESETQQRFIKKTQCIIWQYGNYTSSPVNLHLNGINTQGENIADNGGIKEAYYAYKRWEANNGEEKTLPGLNLNTKQLFWLGAANTWCSKYRPKTLERQIKTGVHSPSPFRVMGSFSNTPEFSQDFNCPINSKMNPSHKCHVW